MGLEKVILAAMASSGFPEYLGLQYEWIKGDRAAYPSQQPIPPSLAAIGSRYSTFSLVALQFLLESFIS